MQNAKSVSEAATTVSAQIAEDRRALKELENQGASTDGLELHRILSLTENRVAFLLANLGVRVRSIELRDDGTMLLVAELGAERADLILDVENATLLPA